MSFAPLKLASSAAWSQAVFTTYSLSLSFFESIVLDALVRGGSQKTTILSDLEGVQGALHEPGATRVGKDYQLEPVLTRKGGVFHPKLSVFCNADDCHVLVGSGNLTFGGWGGNLETVEHLHPSFAATAIRDVADFFDSLQRSNRVRHAASSLCDEITESLRKQSIRGQQRASIRVFNSLEASILKQVAEVADEMGGATRLIAASPFWDNQIPTAFCEALNIEEIYVHSHPAGCVEGTTGSNWPSSTPVKIIPVEAHAFEENASRRLHGKAFEITCRRGRIIVSGSANATSAAFEKDRNIETCVVRSDSAQGNTWKYKQVHPPKLRPALSTKSESEAKSGILRAELEGDLLRGSVFSPRMSGTVNINLFSAEGKVWLGSTSLNDDSDFRVRLQNSEFNSWASRRQIIEVEDSQGRTARGFISIFAYAELRKRAGPVAARILSVLSGSETTADVSAILSWILEDPDRLALETGAKASGSNDHSRDPGEQLLNVKTLTEVAGNKGQSSHENGAFIGDSWNRLVAQLLSALREPRGSIEPSGLEDEAEEDEEARKRTVKAKKKRERDEAKAVDVFTKLFDRLLSPAYVERHIILAFDLAQYVGERIRPDPLVVNLWMRRLIAELFEKDHCMKHPEKTAALVLATCISQKFEPRERYRKARLQLLWLGWSLDKTPPPAEFVRGFLSALGLEADFGDDWGKIQAIRTYQEQARSYSRSLATGVLSNEYDDLLAAAGEGAKTMVKAISDSEYRDEVIVVDDIVVACPRHNMTLPRDEIFKVRSQAVAVASHCCRRIIICTGLKYSS